jgi:ABC-type uncharacterized transport system involved in gliding motility auxiliary subunit
MTNLKYLVKKYLYLPGIILAIAGIVANLLTNQWSPLYISLLAAGTIVLIAWVILNFSSVRTFWQRRSTQIGTNALVATLAVLVILGLINFLVWRSPVRIDLTENQIFTLSPQTQEIVQTLQKPLKVWVFDRDPNSVDKELLQTYRRYNANFEFEFVDPDARLGLAKQFNVKSLGDVYLEYGDKKQLVQSLRVANQREPLSEMKLSSAIEKIQRDRIQNIYFLQGHGEPQLNTTQGGLSEATEALKNKGYQVEGLNLGESAAIPPDTDAIAIVSPKRKLLPGEVEVLKNYSDRGGNLLLAIDPSADPGLEPILKEWGVQLDPRVVIDASGAGSAIGLGPEIPVITQYGNHPITQDFKNGISLYPVARPVSTVKVPGVEAVALLVTNDKMWAESDLTSNEIKFDEGKDIPGPVDLGVALTRTLAKTTNPSPSPASPASPAPSSSPSPPISASPRPRVPASSPSPSPTTSNAEPEKNQPPKTEAKLVVFGNGTFATNGWFEQQLNGDVFLNSIQWLASSEEQPLSIRPKEPKNRRINLTHLQAEMISWLSLVIFPLLGLLLAGLTWWKRR